MRRFRWLTLAAASVVVVVGTTVMIAWMPATILPVGVRAWLTQMQSSSALCLSTCAIGLIALCFERRRAAAAVALLPMIVSAATLVEYLFGPVGVRVLIARLSPDLHPAMMSLSLAASMLAASLALWLLGRAPTRSGSAVVMAAVPLITGGLALFDLTVGPPLPTAWDHSIQMAVHSALACLLLSAGLMSESWHRSRLPDRGVPWWMPGAAAVLLCSITLAFAQALHEREVGIRREQATLAADGLHDAIEFELTNRMDMFERMAARLAPPQSTTESWQADADLNTANARDPYAVLLLLGPDMTPRAAAPRQSVGLPSRAAVLGVPGLHDAIQESAVTNSAALSRCFDIAPGVLGFAIVTPIKRNGVTTGFVVAELGYEHILMRLLNRSPFFVRVSTQGTLLVTHGQPASDDDISNELLDVGGSTLELEVGPSRQGERLQASSLATGVLLFGLLLSCAAGVTVYLLRRVEVQRAAIGEANQQLQFEVEQRRKTEEQLRETSLLQRAVLNSTSYAVVSTDDAGTIRTANRAAERLFGYAAEELVGFATPAIFHVDTPDFAALAPASGQGSVDRREWRCRRKSGEESLVEVSVSTLTDDRGVMSGFVLTGVDVTERARLERLRREFEESLRRTEELLHSVLDASLNGVVAFSAIRGPGGEIVDLLCQLANPAAERLLGQPEHSMVSRTHCEVTGTDAGGPVFQAYCRVIETGKPIDIQHQATTFGNRWFRIVAAPLGSDGITVSFEDITRRKEMDAELEQYIHDVEASRDQIHEQSVTLQWQAEELTRARDEAVAGGQQLERALKMQSDFVSFASHQLRTPLSGMRWLLELAKEEPGQTEDLTSYLADSLSSAERLIGLVNDLLDVSRLEAGRVATAIVPVDLGECSRLVAGDLQANVAKAGHTLTLVGLDSPAGTLADPQLLRQVIVNLLSNSIKYTPHGGQLSIEVTSNDSEVCCAVLDNGLGVPEAARPRLFEKFFRADNVTTIETEGTGLGLYMVRLIIQRFGGRIWYEPAAGGGSRFTFALPRAASGEADGVAA